MILLDTDICIALLTGSRTVIQRRRRADDEVAVSFMTAAELSYGAEKSARPDDNLSAVEQFLLTLTILHSTPSIIFQFGRFKAHLEAGGRPLSDADVFIASTAACYCDLLVTGNIRHFERFEGIRLENWLAAKA